MGIAENIQTREAAEEAFQLMSDYLRESGIVTHEGLRDAWTRVHSMIGQTCQIQPERVREPPKAPRGMTDKQADTFGRKLCPFRKYRDKKYDDVPVDYLRFLVDSNEDLKHYVEYRENEEYEDDD